MGVAGAQTDAFAYIEDITIVCTPALLTLEPLNNK
jgi:hypothetical protein